MASARVEEAELSQNSEEAATSSSSKMNASSKYSGLEINARPICMIVLGMAGSGKTSFVKRLTQLGSLQNMKPYTINLDPAVQEVPYHTNIGKTLSAFIV